MPDVTPERSKGKSAPANHSFLNTLNSSMKPSISPQLSAEVHRGAERYRKMRLAVASSVLSKLVRLGSQTAIVAITLQHLGVTAFGLWVTAAAALGWLSWGQAGLAPGLTNALAAADGEERQADQGIYFTTAIAIVLAICAGLFAAGQALLYWGGGLFSGLAGPASGLDPLLRAQWHTFLQIALLLALLRLPLGLVESAFVGLQRVHVLRVCDIFGQVCAVSAAGLLLLGDAPHALYVLGVGLATECGVLAASLYLVLKLRPELMPSIAKFDLRKSASMFNLSAGYFVIQVTSYIVAVGGVLFLSANHGAASVPAFTLTWQLYQMASGVWMMFITGLWGALGEARARGEWDWVDKTQRRLVLFSTGCAAAFGVGLAALGNFALGLWSGGKVQADPMFLLVMGLYVTIFSWAVVHAQILSALNRVWRQIWASLANAALVLGFCFLLVPPYGALGLAIGLTAACGLTTAWAYPLMLAKIKEQ
jgi:O-antigen/teichoic acid export membrane protein